MCGGVFDLPKIQSNKRPHQFIKKMYLSSVFLPTHFSLLKEICVNFNKKSGFVIVFLIIVRDMGKKCHLINEDSSCSLIKSHRLTRMNSVKQPCSNSYNIPSRSCAILHQMIMCKMAGYVLHINSKRVPIIPLLI